MPHYAVICGDAVQCSLTMSLIKAVFLYCSQIASVAQLMLFKWARQTWAIWAAIQKYNLSLNLSS